MFDPHRGCYIQNTAAWRDSEIADDQLRKRRHQRSHVISYCAHCSLQTKAKRLEKSGEIKQLSLSSIRKLYHISVWKNRSRKTGLPFQMFRFSRPEIVRCNDQVVFHLLSNRTFSGKFCNWYITQVYYVPLSL